MKARNHAFLFEKAQIGTDCRFRGSKYSRQILNKHGSLQDINADLMFVGADGIDAVNGITTFNEGYSVSGAMVTAANKVIAVLDSSKFNRRGFNQVLPIEKIDIIITDDAVSEVDKLALQKTRVKLITV